jgi:hypothetical protein
MLGEGKEKKMISYFIGVSIGVGILISVGASPLSVTAAVVVMYLLGKEVFFKRS